jgi:hypothetical protein
LFVCKGKHLKADFYLVEKTEEEGSIAALFSSVSHVCHWIRGRDIVMIQWGGVQFLLQFVLRMRLLPRPKRELMDINLTLPLRVLGIEMLCIG